MKQRILIVEDDEIFLRPLQRTLELAGYDVLVAPSGEDAIDVLKRDDVDLVLTDKRLPGIDGVDLVRRVKGDHPDVAVVVMTAYGTIGSAVEAMRVGAEDYLVKPFEAPEVLMVARRAIEFQDLKAARRATLRRNQERFTLRNIVARSAAMQEVFELVQSVAGLDTTVLIHGETGVGKELLARSIHFAGARRDRPFVAVNCAAIPDELFESELFGFRKGAFTGALETRRGLFQTANGGTLLLDEVGEMPLGLQSKLLRVIEEKRVTPIGSERPLEIDVRFIATTNKDLQSEAERGAFRRDLFYRLSVMPVRVPPLRERAGDIPLLAQHFLESSALRSKKAVRAIAPAAMQALCRYAWPGNVRELENVIERAVIVAKGDTITDVDRFLSGEGEVHTRADLAQHFLESSALRSRKAVRALAPAAMHALCRYAWPGNVRELENVIERAVIVAKGDTITDVDRFLSGEGEARSRVDLGLPFREAKARVVEDFERAYITGVLEAEGGKLTAAAKHADMDLKNFHEKVTRYGLRRAPGGDRVE